MGHIALRLGEGQQVVEAVDEENDLEGRLLLELPHSYLDLQCRSGFALTYSVWLRFFIWDLISK